MPIVRQGCLRLAWSTTFLACLCLAGCRLTFEVPAAEPVTLTLPANPPGQPGISTPADAALIGYVNRWLADHREGWEYGYVTRAPYVYLSGTSFNIDILENEVSVKTCRHRYRCDLYIRKDNSLLRGLRQAKLLPGF